MARIHGRKGRLYVGIASDSATAEPVAYLNKWSLDSKTDKLDVTAFGDSNKVYAAGLPDAGGSFSGFYDTATAQLYTASADGLARKFYLYPTTDTATTYWFGTGLFDMSVSGGVDEAVTINGSYQAASNVTKVG